MSTIPERLRQIGSILGSCQLERDYTPGLADELHTIATQQLERAESIATCVKEQHTEIMYLRTKAALAIDTHNQLDSANLVLRQAEARCKALEAELKLAIAHDRQPYPTSAAYEKVCVALHDKEARLALVEQNNILFMRQNEDLSTRLAECQALLHKILAHPNVLGTLWKEEIEQMLAAQREDKHG